jgi:pyruvate dehydrogenase E2 component (dihydrolipoamide acetyltransferase)
LNIIVPKLGEGADSGTVVRVYVKEGDHIEKNQNLLDLENEKAVASIPATSAGTIEKVFVHEGDSLKVGQTIVSIQSDSPQPEKPSKVDLAPKSEPRQHESTSKSEIRTPEGLPPPASPTIRKLARDLGIELSKIKGSEPGGQIVLADLRRYIDHLQKLAETKPAEAKKMLESTDVDFSKWGPIKKEPISSLRKTVASRTLESWHNIPHVTQFAEANFQKVRKLKENYKHKFSKQGATLTVTPFLLKAACVCLKKYPFFNSTWAEKDQKIILKEYVHIGIAVDTAVGLLVPVLRDVDKKSILTLSRELATLAAKAKNRKILPDEMQGGTFTLSNQGSIGGHYFTPIINPPQSSVLGVGRPTTRFMQINDATDWLPMLPLCLSYDHRIIDGAQAVRFLNDLVQILENFSEEELRSK